MKLSTCKKQLNRKSEKFPRISVGIKRNSQARPQSKETAHLKKLDEVTETVTDAIQRSCKANDWQTASSLLAQLLDGETRGMYYVYIWQAMNQGMTINMFLDLVLVAE